MNLVRIVAPVVCAGSLSFLLQGCDGSGKPTDTTTSTRPESGGPTTTTTRGPQTKPLTSKEAAAKLNEQYLGFDTNDEKSPLGVTLSWAGQVGTFYGNIFCSSVKNPLKDTSCYKGQADCRLSSALINHQIAVNKTTQFLQPLMNRKTGYVFNQERVEGKWAKCSWLWDGATGNRLNNGCGDGLGELKCDKSAISAFNNICQSTGKTCTAEDQEVKKAACMPYGVEKLSPNPPNTHGGQTSTGGAPEQCYFPGASIDYHGQKDWKPAEGHMREMVKSRVSFSEGSDWEGPNLEKWNEVVLDEHLLLPDIMADPNGAVTAFIFVKSDPVAKIDAGKMRDEYCKYTGCTTVPLVAINTDIEASKGPFEDENAPMTCTVANKDPYATGQELPCCEGLKKVLVDGHYVCKTSSFLATVV